MNTKVPLTVYLIVCTACLCVLIGFIVEAMCIIYKIPDMNMPIGQSFTHVLDTFVGVIAGAIGGGAVGHQLGKSSVEDPTKVETTIVETKPPVAK